MNKTLKISKVLISIETQEKPVVNQGVVLLHSIYPKWLEEIHLVRKTRTTSYPDLLKRHRYDRLPFGKGLEIGRGPF